MLCLGEGESLQCVKCGPAYPVVLVAHGIQLGIDGTDLLGQRLEYSLCYPLWAGQGWGYDSDDVSVTGVCDSGVWWQCDYLTMRHLSVQISNTSLDIPNLVDT